MIDQLLSPQLVELDVAGLHTPEEVLRYAGQMMVKQGKVRQDYVDDVVSAYREIGPYFVITPGIALPHTRPSEKVLEAGVCFIRLAEPVVFHHPENDPVRLVFLLAGTQNESHLGIIRLLGEVLGNPELLQRLHTAKSFAELVG